MDYVAGASMFVSREFLERVGYLAEEYFLYFEEMDWTVRCAGRFRLGFAPQSVVYHKEGRSIGSSTYSRPSRISLLYSLRNRLRFTRQYRPGLVWMVRRRLLYEFLVYLWRTDISAVGLVLGA